jgi:hypothetical protein
MRAPILVSLLLAGCASPGGGIEEQIQGRWTAPMGYTEFHPDGRYVMQVTGGARMTGTYEVRDGGRVAITYDALPRTDEMHLTVSGDSLRMCDPERPELPCGTLVRARD